MDPFLLMNIKTLNVSAKVENNVDYWVADIRNFRSKGLRDCYNACRKQKGRKNENSELTENLIKELWLALTWS